MIQERTSSKATLIGIKLSYKYDDRSIKKKKKKSNMITKSSSEIKSYTPRLDASATTQGAGPCCFPVDGKRGIKIG